MQEVDNSSVILGAVVFDLTDDCNKFEILLLLNS